MGHLWVGLMHWVRIVGGIWRCQYLIWNARLMYLNLWPLLRVPVRQSAGVILREVLYGSLTDVLLCIRATVTLALGAELPLSMNHLSGESFKLTGLFMLCQRFCLGSFEYLSLFELRNRPEFWWLTFHQRLSSWRTEYEQHLLCFVERDVQHLGSADEWDLVVV